MQDSGLTGIILLRGTTAFWGQYPAFLHPDTCHLLGYSPKRPCVKFEIPQRRQSSGAEVVLDL